jgi:Ala-tRNA(Pro) deacylase
MCVIPAPKHINLPQVADLLGEDSIELASETEMAEIFKDCELGAEPPLGSLFGLPTVMDSSLQDDEYLVMQAGTHNESVKMRRADWENLCDPIVARISEH